MKSGGVVVLWLGLVSVGCAAPPMSCETLLTPISISHEQMLGRWLYIGGSSDLPGSRSLGRLLNSIWLDISATTVSNVLAIFQTQRIYGECSGIKYNVTMENSTMLIERPFYLKEVYLQTDCSDCLVVYEEVKSSRDSFRSLLLFKVCPDNIASTDGIAAFNSLLEAKMGQRVATLLDKLFDLFIN
ncbi:uncharacterized protein LOC133404602 isoform X2 [Phycodurus eques]|uniref:uncharacterized protein LOC133404602 isoform X2 n=1 Tax=Phycodurus eques TaxID=693459 RepID=UPI002ACD424D|nr:uncharacterized protein LOC133404602 isoform X2 [Phycodurus eques]